MARASNHRDLRAETKGLARGLAARLNEEIARGHDTTAFSIALTLALFQDCLDVVLDFLGIGLIPIVGQLPGYFLTTVLTAFLWRKGFLLKGKLRIMWWVLGFFVGNLPAFNVLPVQTLVVLYAWKIVRERGQEARRELRDLERSHPEDDGVEEQEDELSSLYEESEEDVFAEQDQGASIRQLFKDQGEDVLPQTTKKDDDIFIPEPSRDPLEKLKRDFLDESYRDAA